MPDRPSDMQNVVPYLAYEDGAAAMRWLARAFGFEEGLCMLDDEGRLMHGEVIAGGCTIMLA